MVKLGAGSARDRSNRCRVYKFGREIERWTERHYAQVISKLLTHQHNDMTLCNGILIAAIQQGLNVDQLAHRMPET